MIQRRQSIYLLIIVILGIVLMFQPVIAFSSALQDGVQRMWELSATGLTELTEEYSYQAADLIPVQMNGIWGLALTTILIPILALVIIFLFKKRILQARLCIFLAALCVGYYAILAVYGWFGCKLIAPEWDILFWACIPLICLVLTLMSARAILKDEALVRAADRLR